MPPTSSLCPPPSSRDQGDPLGQSVCTMDQSCDDACHCPLAGRLTSAVRSRMKNDTARRRPRLCSYPARASVCSHVLLGALYCIIVRSIYIDSPECRRLLGRPPLLSPACLPCMESFCGPCAHPHVFARTRTSRREEEDGGEFRRLF